jgi:predicted nucleic acid-binding protein
LRLVLDSNVFILAFSEPRPAEVARLLILLTDDPSRFELVVGRSILTEVQRNLSPEAFKRCWELLDSLGVIPVEDWQVAYELGAKHQAIGLKAGDAFIAALGEWANADYLITENRHFLDRSRLPFKVVRISAFLAIAEE